MRPMNEQEQFEEDNAGRQFKPMPKAEFVKMVEEASTKKKNATSSQPASSTVFDPIEDAMKDNPGLTREQAEAEARAHGF